MRKKDIKLSDRKLRPLYRKHDGLLRLTNTWENVKPILDTSDKSNKSRQYNKVKARNRRTYRLMSMGYCSYCLRRVDKSLIRVDHIIPRSKGGTNSDFNLVAICEDCNHKKGTQYLLQFMGLI